MGLFFQKKNTPYNMMLKFQKTKNKKKNQGQQVKDESVVLFQKMRPINTIRKNQVKSQVTKLQCQVPSIRSKIKHYS